MQHDRTFPARPVISVGENLIRVHTPHLTVPTRILLIGDYHSTLDDGRGAPYGQYSARWNFCPPNKAAGDVRRQRRRKMRRSNGENGENGIEALSPANRAESAALGRRQPAVTG